MDLRPIGHLISLELWRSLRPEASASQSAKQGNQKAGAKEVKVGNRVLAGVFAMKNSGTHDKLAVTWGSRRDVR